jgi:hypothetical protein
MVKRACPDEGLDCPFGPSRIAIKSGPDYRSVTVLQRLGRTIEVSAGHSPVGSRNKRSDLVHTRLMIPLSATIVSTTLLMTACGAGGTSRGASAAAAPMLHLAADTCVHVEALARIAIGRL